MIALRALSIVGALLLVGCGGESAAVGSGASSAAKSGKPAASSKPSAAAKTNQPASPSGPAEEDRITAADFEEEAEKDIEAGNAESELSALEKEIAEDK